MTTETSLEPLPPVSPTIPRPDPNDPNTWLAYAVERGMGLETLKELIQIKDDEDSKRAKREYLIAFQKFQSEVPKLEKTKAGHNSKYAALGNIGEAIQPALNNCELCYRFDIDNGPEQITVKTIVYHVGGHSESTSMTGPPDTSGSKSAIQSQGSTTSYLQRYTLIAALGLTTADEDNDGNTPDQPISPEQALMLKQRLESAEADVGRYCASLGIDNVDAMPAKLWGQANNLMARKEEQVKKERAMAQ